MDSETQRGSAHSALHMAGSAGLPRDRLTRNQGNRRGSPRPGDPGVYDFDWLNHSTGYGFTFAGSPMSRAEMEGAIKSFLAEVNPATGFLD